MQFSLGFIKSENQFLLKNFSPEESDQGKILELAEIKESKLHGIMYPKELLTDELRAQLEEETRFFPIRSGEDFSLNFENFENLSFENAETLFNQLQDNWVLQNNITLIEELFKVVEHLKALWPNDRTTFFEELWFTLRNTFGSQELKIIYNDMVPAGERNKLVRAKVEGSRIPNPLPAGDVEEQIMKHYESQFQRTFEITEFNKERGELVITATIRKSPIVIMAKTSQLSGLQKALLTSLFDGLNRD